MAGDRGHGAGGETKITHTHISTKTNNTRFMSTAIQKLIGYKELGKTFELSAVI